MQTKEKFYTLRGIEYTVEEWELYNTDPDKLPPYKRPENNPRVK